MTSRRRCGNSSVLVYDGKCLCRTENLEKVKGKSFKHFDMRISRKAFNFYDDKECLVADCFKKKEKMWMWVVHEKNLEFHEKHRPDT